MAAAGRQPIRQRACLWWASAGCFPQPACPSPCGPCHRGRQLSGGERTLGWHRQPSPSPSLSRLSRTQPRGCVPLPASPPQRHTVRTVHPRNPPATLLSRHLLRFLLLLLLLSHLCRGLHRSSSSPPSAHPSLSPGASIASCLSPLFPRVMSTPSQL